MSGAGPAPADHQASPYAEAVAAILRRAPRRLNPHDAAQIGDLIGPIDSGVQDADAA